MQYFGKLNEVVFVRDYAIFPLRISSKEYSRFERVIGKFTRIANFWKNVVLLFCEEQIALITNCQHNYSWQPWSNPGFTTSEPTLFE